MSTAPGTPVTGQNSALTLSASSRSNGQLTVLTMDVVSVTLKDQSGHSVSLLSSPQTVEFIHTNGDPEPIAQGLIPQGTYTSAAITYNTLNASYLGFTQPNTITSYTGTGGSTATTTVNFTTPLTISGKAMVIPLDLLTSQSASLPPAGGPDIKFSPAFSLESQPVASTSEPASSLLVGRVSAVNAASSTLQLNTIDDAQLTFRTNGSTSFQGIADISAVQPGMFAMVGTSVQDDGGLLANNIQIIDPTVKDIAVGIISSVYTSGRDMFLQIGQREGDDLAMIPSFGEAPIHFASNATFAVSRQVSTALPFSPGFNLMSLMPGQRLSIGSPNLASSNGSYPVAGTVTLLPQTINGTVANVTTSGSYTVYTLALAPYDPISLLNGGAEVSVYVDAATQNLASSALSSGSLLRMHGLLFSDHGVPRLVCDWIKDGVAE
ncbi:DUF5666 domain-containing protein [Acidipila rosea]|uniref:DUF5666 domain-containing protein n=1 Tax=Acidipila rosea TaxID=768535 RepID=A0A4R1L1D3_9BACT|nr:DUF5666 domain-containing protein [Acidipila rosea]TCK70817.1 hypothetical protein C7378_3206 [Acidipila rosea]